MPQRLQTLNSTAEKRPYHYSSLVTPLSSQVLNPAPPGSRPLLQRPPIPILQVIVHVRRTGEKMSRC